MLLFEDVYPRDDMHGFPEKQSPVPDIQIDRHTSAFSLLPPLLFVVPDQNKVFTLVGLLCHLHLCLSLSAPRTAKRCSEPSHFHPIPSYSFIFKLLHHSSHLILLLLITIDPSA